MFKPYYECHVTFLGERDMLPSIAQEIEHWKTSIIDGDPVLGEGVKCYLTRHYPEKESMTVILADMNYAAQRLKTRSLEVLRQKIELVIWDSRTSVYVSQAWA